MTCQRASPTVSVEFLSHSPPFFELFMFVWCEGLVSIVLQFGLTAAHFKPTFRV